MRNNFVKDEKGFTGLEAAIVLIAFVVVAAVFSYVMLGAGFFTTQKSQEVVHTGVTQASSSVELSGDVIAGGAGGHISTVDLFLQLTSGGSSVDMENTLLVVSAPNIPPTELKYITGATPSSIGFVIFEKFNADNNLLIDRAEKFDVQIDLDAVATAVAGTNHIGPNQDFQIEIKPPSGAPYIIHRKAPPAIDTVMTLV